MATNHADRVLVLDRGVLVADAPPAEALGEPVISWVWGVEAKWLGDRSDMALTLKDLRLDKAGTPSI
jgi:iron complex transport system ATP-binding protein